MADNVLFPQESIIAQQMGTLFIYPEQMGLAALAVGNKERHSVACSIAITQYRVLCEAYWMNKFTGRTSLLLDTITAAHEVAAFPSPHLHITAGIPYEFKFFMLDQPRAALTTALRQSNAIHRSEARHLLLHELLPEGCGERPPRACVKQSLDALVIKPETVMYALSLYNLWVSLGNA